MGAAVPTSEEEVVEALLDFLVEPLLPKGPKLVRQLPSLNQQGSVAKQVHAAVLLYNYYHRKLQPEFEFLDFASFCKLAVVLKPTLIAYMKLLHLENYSEVNDFQNQLSVTEKAIMDACNISAALDASKDFPSTMEWPITKISVFLIDSKMENCFLIETSTTNGVWSVIEKDIDVFETKSGGTLGRLATRIGERPSEQNQSTDTTPQNFAKLAVKEVAGIDQNGVKVLESHVSYSLNKEKAASHFYVMQSSQSWDGHILVPIKDAITSLEGPLVKMSSRGYIATPAVKYFQLLPYAGILSNFMSRHKNREKTISISSSLRGGSQEENCESLPSQLKPHCLENLLDACTSNENSLSEMALRAFIRKREELSQKMRNIENEIALCDETIQTILDGGENSLALKIDTILAGCFDAYLKGAADPHRTQFEGQSRRLSEALLSVQNPCRQLDEICQKNNWILPTYQVFMEDGGFRSYVTVKGVDFELSCGSDVHSSPKEARTSASSKMIADLQNFASQIK